jgi:acyl-CoA dehydrogenase
MMRAVNWWRDDDPFRRALASRLDQGVLERAEPLLEEMGGLAPEFFAPRARLADRHRPILERYDRSGERVDRITYHAAYEEMTRRAYGFGLVRPADARGPFPHLVKFALGYLFSQGEAGPVLAGDQHDARTLVERLATAYRGRAPDPGG